MKKWISFILTLALLLGGVTTQAEAIIRPGMNNECGEAVTFSYKSNGKLRISGTGDMKNYSYKGGSYGIWTTAPWSGNTIHSATVDEGVTSIGSYSFYSRDNMISLVIPKSVTWIGAGNDGVHTVYYAGSEEEWNQITIKVTNAYSNATIYYHSTGPDDIGNTETKVPDTAILTPVLDKITNPEEGLTISWLRPLNTEDVEYVADGYYVYRKTAGGSYSKIATLSGIDNTSYTDTNVTHGTVYTYTVAAYYNGQTGNRDETGLTGTYIGPLADVVVYPEHYYITRGEGEEAFINDHLYFADSETYYDRMDSRFSGLLLDSQTMDEYIAEGLYDWIDDIGSLTRLEYQKLSIFENPYDAILAELVMDITKTNYVEGDVSDATWLAMLGVAKNYLDLFRIVQPDYEISDADLLPACIELFTDHESLKQSSPALYAELTEVAQKFIEEKGLDAFMDKLSGSAKYLGNLATITEVLDEGMAFAEWLTKSGQYVTLVNRYAALTDALRTALYDAADHMTNAYQRELLLESLDKLEAAIDPEAYAGELFGEIFGNYLESFYNVAVSDYVVTAGIPALSGALNIAPNYLYAAVVAYNVGWSLSEILTGNGAVVAAREHIRADAYMAAGAYDAMISARNTMFNQRDYASAVEFDAAYRVLQAVELHALNTYEEYLRVSQQSFGQFLLHGCLDSASYELAIAGREVVAWDTANCHGDAVYSSPAAQVLLPNTTFITLTSSGGETFKITSSGISGSIENVSAASTGSGWLITLPADGSYTMKLSGGDELACAVTLFDKDGGIKSQSVYEDLSSGTTVKLTESGDSLNCTVKDGGTTVAPTAQPGSTQQTIPEWADGENDILNFRGKMIALDTDANVEIAEEDLNSYVMTIEGGTVVRQATWLTDITVEVKDGKQYINILDGWYTLHITGSSATDIVVMDSDESGKVSRTVTFDDVRLSNEDVKLSVNCDAVGQKYTLVQGRKTIQPTSDTADLKLAFVDVKSRDYFYDPVRWAVANGITSGTSSTTFSPHQACTRAQAVTFLWRAAGSPEPESTKMPFTDVAKGSYYYKAVLWAVEQGITSGTSANTFSPNTKCTRAQIVTFLWRADDTSPEWTGSTGFSDVSVSAYYWFPVRWAVKEGITSGTSATTFSPNADCTRAQIVTFLYRALAT